MKIAVASQNFRTVAPHAGRTRRFLIYEIQAGGEPVEVDRLDLPKAMAFHEFHGCGRHPLDGVQVLIADSFGPGLADRLRRRGIVVVASDAIDPLEAVDACYEHLEVIGVRSCNSPDGLRRHHHCRHGRLREERGKKECDHEL